MRLKLLFNVLTYCQTWVCCPRHCCHDLITRRPNQRLHNQPSWDYIIT